MGLSNCQSNPTLGDIMLLLQNITHEIIGQQFLFGDTDIKAYSNLFSCLVIQAGSNNDFVENLLSIELFLNATTKVLSKFIEIHSQFIEEAIVDLGKFSQSIKLSLNYTYTTQLFTLRFTKWLQLSDVDIHGYFHFSKDETQICIPGSLIQEVFSNQNCLGCIGVSVSIIIFNLDRLRNVITTENELSRPNGLNLKYFEQPEIISDIVSMEFSNIQATNFYHR